MIILNLLKQGIKDVIFIFCKIENYLVVWLDVNTSFPWCETITISYLIAFLYIILSLNPMRLKRPLYSEKWINYWNDK